MKNAGTILLGLASIATSITLYMMYRKDKEIEENCGCKKPTLAGNNIGRPQRISEVAVNGMMAVGGGVGGGRSAMDISSVQPRGVAITTFGGANSSAIFKNKIITVDFNRLDQFRNKVRNNNGVKRSPYTQTGRVISN